MNFGTHASTHACSQMKKVNASRNKAFLSAWVCVWGFFSRPRNYFFPVWFRGNWLPELLFFAAEIRELVSMDPIDWASDVRNYYAANAYATHRYAPLDRPWACLRESLNNWRPFLERMGWVTWVRLVALLQGASKPSGMQPLKKIIMLISSSKKGKIAHTERFLGPK